MPQYIFNIQDGSGSSIPETVILDSATDARDEAVHLLGEFLKVADRAFWQDADWRVNVSAETGELLYSLRVVGIETPVASNALD